MTRSITPFYSDLARAAQAENQASIAQSELDAGFHSFTDQASSLEAVASFTVAGLVGKLARFGILATGLGRASVLQFASHAGAISAEAASLMGMSRLWGHSSPHASLSHEFISQCINFGAFRLLGSAFRSSNLLLQHFGQSLAMMGGHELAAACGYEEHSAQSFFQKFLNANLSTLHISAGSVLSGGLFGGKLQRLEHSMEISSHLSAARMRQRSTENLRALQIAMHADEAEVLDAPPALEDLEASVRNPKNLLDNLNLHFNRARDRFESVKASLDGEISQGYQKEIDRIQKRIRYWEDQNQLAAKIKSDVRRAAFNEDILIGERLLLDQILQLGAPLQLEPIDETESSNWTLRTRLNIGLNRLRGPNGPKPSNRPPSLVPPKPGAVILEAAIAQDSGLGPDLTLWPHQLEALKAIEGDLRLLRDWKMRLNSGEVMPTPDLDFFQGTVVLPVGGGKTRLMSASFAQAIELGMYIEGVDKFFIFNHTNSIHRQNRKEVQRLNSYFKARFGRDMTVSEYKADQRDLSGDVVVLSIPTVQTAESRRTFKEELIKELSKSGIRGQVIVGAVDEIHHMADDTGGAETWLKLMETMREVSPHFYREGFTGSESKREGRVIFRRTERQLLMAGITPRRILMRVEGMNLTSIRVSKAGNFNKTEITSALTDGPEAIARNTRIYEAMEKVELIRDTRRPSGKAHFQPFLYFADMLEHATFSAEQYARHFSATSAANPGSALRERKVRVLGQKRGAIKKVDMERAITDYRAGIIDSIVCIISGDTSKVAMPLRDGSTGDMTEYILEQLKDRENGCIEGAFTVEAIAEGTDAKGVKQQIGAHPRFSLRGKKQEAGRTNRRADGEISADGELVSDPPCVLYDVIDSYMKPGHALINYGNVVGALQPKTEFGVMFDVMANAEVETLDRSGRASPRPTAREQLDERLKPTPPPPRPPRPPVEESGSARQELVAMIELLREIIARDYEDNVDLVARDFNVTTDQILQLLAGEGWIDRPWFWRRLGTLLYQPRELFYEKLQEIRGRGASRAISDGMREAFSEVVDRGNSVLQIQRGLAGLARSRPAEAEYFQFALSALENMYGNNPRVSRTTLATRLAKNGFKDRENIILQFEEAFRASLGEHSIAENNFASVDEASIEFACLAGELRQQARRRGGDLSLSREDAEQALVAIGLASPAMASYINDFALPLFRNTYGVTAPRTSLDNLNLPWPPQRGKVEKYGGQFLLTQLREMFRDRNLSEASEELTASRTQAQAMLRRSKNEFNNKTAALRLEVLRGMARDFPEYSNYWRLCLEVFNNQYMTVRGMKSATDLARTLGVQESEIHTISQLFAYLFTR